RLAVEADGAFVGLDGAVDDLHQRRLARAVLAQHGMRLARLHDQRDAAVGDDAGVGLGDVRQFKPGCAQPPFSLFFIWGVIVGAKLAILDATWKPGPSDSSAAARSWRWTMYHPTARCSSCCARTWAAPVRRKVAARAIAAPAPSCWASCKVRAPMRALASAQSTVASASRTRWTGSRCGRSKTSR